MLARFLHFEVQPWQLSSLHVAARLKLVRVQDVRKQVQAMSADPAYPDMPLLAKPADFYPLRLT